MSFLLPIQQVLVHFRINLQKAIDFIQKLVVVSSQIVKLRNKQHFSEDSDVDRVNIHNSAQHWVLRDLVQRKVYRNIFCLKLTVLDKMTVAQISFFRF